MNHVMLDLETMGNGANAAIVAIGAVRFDENEVCDKFYKIIDLQSSIDAGLEVNASTVYWWLGQEEQPRQDLCSEIKANLSDTLLAFADWLGHRPSIWGNGAAFDNVILSNAYKKIGLKQPWHFASDRCFRTIKSLYPQIKLDRKGTYHRAVDDAETQALHLIKIMKHLDRPLS